MTQLVLRPGEQRRLVRGEDTVYAAQVQDIRGELVPGQAADLLDNAGNFVGRGLVGGSSKALLRLLTRSREDIDRAFFERRLRRAVEYRRRLGETECCRLVFGDADGLPGLTVDKFGPVLSLQTLTAGMDQRKELLCDLLEELLHPDAIYERNDVKVREKEGLAQQKGLLRGALPGELLVRENGFLLKVDVAGGQKTGSYLDQRENHAALAPYVRGRRVLDVCCCTGGFGLHAAGYGAAHVTAVDVSAAALREAQENYARNGLFQADFVKADMFDLLRGFERQGRKFDVVVLDPPAFCKNKSALQKAFAGYREVNSRALRLLQSGGMLVTCSCSHYMTPDLFWEMLCLAAQDAGVQLRLVEQRMQSRDHPVTLGNPQSLYLKCFFLEVL